MFNLIEQVLIVLLNFSRFLATKYLSLNDEQCMVGPAIFDLNPVELKYYPLMVNLNVNVKVFNVITNRIEAKTYISYDCKCKFNRTACSSSTKWNNNTCHCERENYSKYKIDYSWNASTGTWENSKNVKIFVDDSMIACCYIMNKQYINKYYTIVIVLLLIITIIILSLFYHYPILSYPILFYHYPIYSIIILSLFYHYSIIILSFYHL